jgi:hypothetical protein
MHAPRSPGTGKGKVCKRGRGCSSLLHSFYSVRSLHLRAVKSEDLNCGRSCSGSLILIHRGAACGRILWWSGISRRGLPQNPKTPFVNEVRKKIKRSKSNSFLGSYFIKNSEGASKSGRLAGKIHGGTFSPL